MCRILIKIFVSCSEFSSEEELVEYLCKTYSDMVASGCENFYLSAQSLVLVPLHYLKDQKVENPQVLESVIIKICKIKEGDNLLKGLDTQCFSWLEYRYFINLK